MTRCWAGVLVLIALVAVSCSDEPAPASPSQVTVTNGSGSATGTTPQPGCALPATPTGLRVTSMVSTLVELAWHPVVGATSYTLLVGATPGAADILNANTTQASFRFTARDGRQFARVQAHNSCGAGPSTGSIEFTVRP
jgi:hypothetical protein